MAIAEIAKPERWDIPFGSDMTEEDIDRILHTPPFSNIDPSKFTNSCSLRGIIRNDARIVRYLHGDIVVREGDYGNSAFFVISGIVQVIVDQKNKVPESLLGRQKRESKGFFSTVRQLWKTAKGAEIRDPSIYSQAQGTGIAQRKDNSAAEGVRIFLQDVPGILNKYKRVQIKRGEFFGEIAALGRTPRTATIFADQSAELLEIRWQGLRDIRNRDPAIKKHIDTNYRERSLKAELHENPIFKHLSEESIERVVKETEFETYGKFEWFASFQKVAQKSVADRLRDEPIIAEEKNYSNGLILVRSGFARVSQRFGSGHRTLSYLGRGQAFGFDEIVHNWRYKGKEIPLQSSLRALGYVDVLFIPTSVMEKEVLPTLNERELPSLFELADTLENKAKRSAGVLQKEDTTKAGVDHQMLEFLVENRYINGTATMVIDMNRCVRCDDCVRACADTHDNNPRFIRHGQVFGHYMIANACMHCTDPVCMIGCPTGAIHRESAGQVTINDITCIGCATCANSCPYNNIRMVQIRDKSGSFLQDKQSELPIFKATKCDLCIDQMVSPSCQSACPHDALQRVNMRDLPSFGEWLNR